MGWKSFNDRLALLLLVMLPGLWVLQMSLDKSFPPEVNGGLLVTWTLVIQYYFRRKPGEDNPQ